DLRAKHLQILRLLQAHEGRSRAGRQAEAAGRAAQIAVSLKPVSSPDDILRPGPAAAERSSNLILTSRPSSSEHSSATQRGTTPSVRSRGWRVQKGWCSEKATSPCPR